MKSYILTAALACGATCLSASNGYEGNANPYYGYVSTGYAWSRDAGISKPKSRTSAEQWDAAAQGYDASLGNGSFVTVGFGKQFWEMVDFDFAYTLYQTFRYQKRQTGTSDSPGFTGSTRIRFFDLDHQSALFNATIAPYSWDLGCFALTPYLGAGIGTGINRVSNFRTVGATSEVGSTSSIGPITTKVSFAWNVTTGLCFKPAEQGINWSIGYRYYDGGDFEGPSKIQTFSSSTSQFSVNPFEGRLKTHQLTLTLGLDF